MVIMHIADEEAAYLEAAVQEILDKYCAFMPMIYRDRRGG